MDKLSGKVAEESRAEWLELGFFYDMDEFKSEWNLHGSKNGLLNLARQVRIFSEKEEVYGEHEHLLPHWYLTISFDEIADINKRGIQGRKNDLLGIAQSLETYLEGSEVGSTIQAHKCLEHSTFTMLFHVYEDGFDPSTLDPQL